MLRILIIIPAYNEEQLIGKTLISLVQQSFKPSQLIVVNDSSTDKTPQIVQGFVDDYPFIRLVNKKSANKSRPGAKVIEAFNEGLAHADKDYDIICKFDADLIFPPDYLEKLNASFTRDEQLGMFGGVCTIQQGNVWEIESLTNLDHIRGALKAYRKNCFQQIGGLKKAMGWDTLDELLARYNHWKVEVNPELQVQHLKATATTYSKKLPEQFGRSVYRMRYQGLIGFLAIAKLASKKKSLSFLFIGCLGFLKAMFSNEQKLVSKEEGRFIRNYRMQSIKQRFLS